MTTIDISQIYGTQYTWDNQTLLWGSDDAATRTWDSSYDVISYSLSAGETVDIAEAVSSEIAILKSETLTLEGFIAKAPNANFGELFEFQELSSSAFGKFSSESLILAESGTRTPAKDIVEVFSVVDSGERMFGLNRNETIVFQETVENGVGYIREFLESIAFAEIGSRSVEIEKYEIFNIVDAWRRQGDMVISDMMLSSGDMSLEDFADFMSYGNVPGYEKWRGFIPGDYEYREAMFRVVLESKNDDRGLLTTLQAVVDVPDLIDRGSASITNAIDGITVVYNRNFHITPEITLAARGGLGGNPIAPEFNGVPTKASFGVRLRDTVTGAFVTGTFTWAAHGY